ncbi:TonB-dependent receptor [Pseudomonas sp. S60]|uniref:TonB-dependent receptor n=1 Tax=unclassified Pseudomonas TaxID=196821 RepID=UPI001F4302DB|nr:TonB-dependent receptor [Pseudomonas sp. S32]MBK5009533.1 TonB-dependent receptor [Pseudomonas sp. S60]
MQHRFKCHLLYWSVALAYTWQGASVYADDLPISKPEARDDSTLSKVVVNARRRDEAAQDVPAPMTTLTGEHLQDNRVSAIQDIQQLAPSVNMPFWHAAQSSLSIRGIGNNPRNDGLEGSAAVYIDNVYLSRTGMAAFDLLDIEQVEVLRGAQGTLFGKNSTAGVVNIRTKAPTFYPENHLSVSTGQYGLKEYRGSFSGPLTDAVAGRISLSRSETDGFIKNVHDGDYQGRTRQGIRGQLLFEPDDDFSLRLIAEYNDEDLDLTRSFLSFGPLASTRARYARVGAQDPITDPKKLKVNTDGRNGSKVYQNALSAEANWKLDGGYSLTSISAWRLWQFDPYNDDLTTAPVWTNMGASANASQFSQEIRLASPKDDTFEYVVGAYYFKGSVGNNLFYNYGPQADAWFGLPVGALSNVSSKMPSKVSTDSYAVFGQGTWHLNPQWDLTLGLRGTYEEKTGRVKRYEPTGDSVTGAALAARNARLGAYDSGNLKISGSSPSGMASISYKVNPDLMVYSSLTHGEKSGGINPSLPGNGASSLLIGPERANDAELGFKSTLWGGRVSFNANLFWSWITGYQATVWDREANTSYLSNVGSMRSRGIEFETTVMPIKGLTLNANGSFIDAIYMDYQDGQCPPETPGTTCNLTGKRVSGSPRQIFNANARYQWALDSGIRPYLNASYSYRAKSFGTGDDSDYGVIPSYSLTNLSGGVRIDDGDAQWDVSLWVRNVFNKFYYTSVATGAGNIFAGTIGDPRTVGATVSYDF